MARLRLGLLGAILFMLAALAAEIRPVPAGPDAVTLAAGEVAADPIPHPSGPLAASLADLLDEPEDDIVAARPPAAAPAPRPSHAATRAARADAPQARPEPRSTGPPGIAPTA